MKTAIIKMLAKIVLDNMGTLIVWIVEKSTDAYVKDSDKFKSILSVVEGVAANAASVAGVMKDGQISEEEEAALVASTTECADKIKSLL